MDATNHTTAEKALRSWPIYFLAAPAAVATWSGWVGLGRMTGFGKVNPLPGILDSFTVDTAITLPIGVEAYAAYALGAWLSATPMSTVTRKFAAISAVGSLGLGMAGQVAYHLLEVAHDAKVAALAEKTGQTVKAVAKNMPAAAPWWIVTLVSCLPVLVLGMGAALGHMIHRDRRTAATNQSETAPVVVPVAEPSRLVAEPATAAVVATELPPAIRAGETTTQPTNRSPVVTTPLGGLSTARATTPAAPVADPEPEATNRLPTTPDEPVGNSPSNHDDNHSTNQPSNHPGNATATNRKRTRRSGSNHKTAKSDPATPAENARAVARYRKSVADGNPLSQRGLAAEFPGRSSYWARDRIKEAGLRPVGRTNQPAAETNQDTDQPADDDATNRAANQTATTREAIR